MLYITAIIKGNVGTNEALINIFEPLVAATRLEAGCQRYDVLRTTSDPQTYIILEEWLSEESIQAHNKSEHFHQFVQAVQPLLAEPLHVYITEKVV